VRAGRSVHTSGAGRRADERANADRVSPSSSPFAPCSVDSPTKEHPMFQNVTDSNDLVEISISAFLLSTSALPILAWFAMAVF
jgi:hypothetical protein